MKKIKECLILLVFPLLVGCSVEANIVIPSNRKLEEDIQISIPEQELYQFTSLEEAGKSYPQTYKRILTGGHYNYQYSIKNNTVVPNIKSKNNTLNQINKNKVYSLLYDITFDDDNGLQKINAQPNENLKVHFIGNPNFQNVSLLNSIKVNIQFHNIVQNDNADYYNEKTNTYTWEITKKDLERNIYFEITNDKRYDIITMYYLKNYGFLLIFILVVFCGLCIIVNKSRKKNTF